MAQILATPFQTKLNLRQAKSKGMKTKTRSTKPKQHSAKPKQDTIKQEQDTIKTRTRYHQTKTRFWSTKTRFCCSLFKPNNEQQNLVLVEHILDFMYDSLVLNTTLWFWFCRMLFSWMQVIISLSRFWIWCMLFSTWIMIMMIINKNEMLKIKNQNMNKVQKGHL